MSDFHSEDESSILSTRSKCRHSEMVYHETLIRFNYKFNSCWRYEKKLYICKIYGVVAKLVKALVWRISYVSSILTPSTTKGREIYPAINLVLKTSGTLVVWGSTPLSSAKYGVRGEMVNVLDCGSSFLRVRVPSDTHLTFCTNNLKTILWKIFLKNLK